jgi:hypothetical protein
MKRKEREAMVVSLMSLGMSSDPLIIKCTATAKDFAKRITEAKTEEERDKIRADFQRWAATDQTFLRITAGVRTLLD